jgi:RND family efflux transporter MFP subunit
MTRQVIGIIGLALVLTACGSDDEAAQAPAQRTVAAKSIVLAADNRAAYHAAPATVVAVERAEVASRLMGYISNIAVVEGQAVSRGQRLFSVDPLDVQGQVDQAHAGVAQAESAYADAKADFERFSNLYKEEVVSRQQLDKARLQHDLAAARLAQAKAGLGTASGQMRYATVTAPITGVVTRKLANAGDLAAPGRPVLVLEDPTRLQIETSVPEDVLGRLKPGLAVPVEVDGVEGRVEGKVARISPAADPVSRTFLVKLDVAARGLRSGAFARALFPAGERTSLAVPATALVNRAGIDGVFVLDKDAVAQFRMVRRGGEVGGLIEIQAGLQAGERIVIEGADKLESGDKVTG